MYLSIQKNFFFYLKDPQEWTDLSAKKKRLHQWRIQSFFFMSADKVSQERKVHFSNARENKWMFHMLLIIIIIKRKQIKKNYKNCVYPSRKTIWNWLSTFVNKCNHSNVQVFFFDILLLSLFSAGLFYSILIQFTVWIKIFLFFFCLHSRFIQLKLCLMRHLFYFIFLSGWFYQPLAI